MSDIAPDPHLQRLQTARDQIAQGDLENAAHLLNQARQQVPADPRVPLLQAALAEKSSNLQDAFKWLRHSVAMAPEWWPGLLELALLLARQNQWQEAVEVVEKALALAPQELQVLSEAINITHRAGHLQRAVQHARRGLELAPGHGALRRLLARDLTQMAQYAEALQVWGALIDENPQDTEALVGRVQTLVSAGCPQQAIQDTIALLALAPGNTVYAYYNTVAHGNTPPHPPLPLVQALFDGMAEQYNQHVGSGPRYQLCRQVADHILANYPDKQLHVLDLGCGTGLLGRLLGRLEGALVGVDISRGMIDQALRHKVYQRFHHSHLLEVLEETSASLFQVITALDVFGYVGDLQQALPNALRILVPGGQLVFSCEAASEDGRDLVLLPSGRYAHKRSHVQALCGAAGFDPIEVQETVLRHENHAPVHGFVVVARKPA